MTEHIGQFASMPKKASTEVSHLGIVERKVNVRFWIIYGNLACGGGPRGVFCASSITAGIRWRDGAERPFICSQQKHKGIPSTYVCHSHAGAFVGASAEIRVNPGFQLAPGIVLLTRIVSCLFPLFILVAVEVRGDGTGGSEDVEAFY